MKLPLQEIYRRTPTSAQIIMCSAYPSKRIRDFEKSSQQDPFLSLENAVQEFIASLDANLLWSEFGLSAVSVNKLFTAYKAINEGYTRAVTDISLSQYFLFLYIKSQENVLPGNVIVGTRIDT